MSTLTALKLERDLEITRRAMAPAEKPRLEMRWALDAETGKPVAVWTAVQPVPAAIALPEFPFV
jgi:hypothetical protein